MGYALKAAEALRLAAASVWCSGSAPSCLFNSKTLSFWKRRGESGFRLWLPDDYPQDGCLL